MSMIIDGSNGATFPNGSVQTVASPIIVATITDSTDIVLNNWATSGYNNVGSPFTVTIPTSGFIRLGNVRVRLQNDATAATHNTVFGIRIGSTNYWFGTYNNNGTQSLQALYPSLSVANAYFEYSGAAAYAPTLDITGNSIPTGSQTVQLIASYATNVVTLKGTVTQTRVSLEFVSG